MGEEDTGVSKTAVYSKLDPWALSPVHGLSSSCHVEMIHSLICSFPFSSIKKILKIQTVPYLCLETCRINSEEIVMDFQGKIQRGEEETGSSKPLGSCLFPNNKMPKAPSTPFHLATNLKQLPLSANIISEKSQEKKTFKFEGLETGQEIYSIFSKQRPSKEKLRRGLNWIVSYLDSKGATKELQIELATICPKGLRPQNTCSFCEP